MKYDVKSVIIGRKKRPQKDDPDCPCFIALFDINEPHKSGEVPKEILDFEHIAKVSIDTKHVDYMLAGNDVVLDNLSSVDIEHEGNVIKLKAE